MDAFQHKPITSSTAPSLTFHIKTYIVLSHGDGNKQDLVLKKGKLFGCSSSRKVTPVHLMYLTRRLLSRIAHATIILSLESAQDILPFEVRSISKWHLLH